MIVQKWFAFLFDNRVRYIRLTTKKYEKLKIVGNSISVNIIMALTTVLLSPQNEALSCLQNHSFVNRLSSMRQLKRCALRPKRSIFNCLTDISLLTMYSFLGLIFTVLEMPLEPSQPTVDEFHTRVDGVAHRLARMLIEEAGNELLLLTCCSLDKILLAIQVKFNCGLNFPFYIGVHISVGCSYVCICGSVIFCCFFTISSTH